MLDRLKQVREKTGLSQRKAAEEIGIAPQSYWQYETGKYEPDLETLIKIANFFNTSVDYLIGASDIPEMFTVDEAQTVSLLRSVDGDCRELIYKLVDKLPKE